MLNSDQSDGVTLVAADHFLVSPETYVTVFCRDAATLGLRINPNTGKARRRCDPHDRQSRTGHQADNAGRKGVDRRTQRVQGGSNHLT